MADSTIPELATGQAHKAIRWQGVFASPEMELQYRREHSAEDLSRVRLVVGVTVIGSLVYISNDHYFSGETPLFWLLLAIRLSVLFFSLAVLVKLHSGVTLRVFDWLVLIWSLVSSSALVFVASTRPVEYLGHTILDILFVLLIYLAVPLPVLWQACSAGLFSAAIVVLGFWIKPWEDDPTILAVLTALFIANILGAGVSRELHIWRRQQFLALCRQRELSAKLERAANEIKALQGILPICMHCRRVRDDSGYWQMVEVYVSEHTGAEFSHGLCPECATTVYPQVDWEKARARVLKKKTDQPK